MPAEFRQFLLSNNELIAARCEYNQVAQTKLPQGIIVSCTPVAAAKVVVRLERVDQASGETQITSLSPGLVAAALLRYCIERRIPTPRSAAKSIQIHGDEVSLNVRIEGRAKRSEQMASAEAGTARMER